MFITIDFDEDYVKDAIAYNYKIKKEDLDTDKIMSNFSGTEILDSIQIYKEKDEDKGMYIDFSDVADVRKGYITMSEECFMSVDSDGKAIPGTENLKTFLYNTAKLSKDEYETLLKSGEYIFDNRIIETTWEKARNVSTLSEKFKKEQGLDKEEEKDYE